MSSERLQRIHEEMQRHIDAHEISGAVTLVARRGRIAHFEAHGLMDIESGKPMAKDAIFRLASMTKPVTAVAVMMLVEQGKVRLNDPVSRYIPEFKDTKVAMPRSGNRATSRPEVYLVPADREITIVDLLTHSAGLVTGTAPALSKELASFAAEGSADETISSYCRRLAKMPLNFQPGTAWQYGPATNVLGCVVEVASGQSFDRFLAERIFRPLEMNDTSFYVPDDVLDRLVTLSAPGPGGLRAVRPAAEMRGSRTYFSGGGGLFSTAEDYLRFCHMLLQGGSYKGPRLLSRKSVELMTANHIGDMPIWPDLAGYRFGLGFRVLTDPGQNAHLTSVGSYGWSGAFGTYFWIDPKEEMVGILMIQTTGPANNLRYEIQNLAEQAIVD
jgi:CubicO group peptidase (beta-lactamase class C family)